MARTLIADGTVVTASDTFRADVWIDGERVVALTDPSERAALGVPDRTIDAAGRYVLPGGVDVHTHLELPFPGGVTSDDFATGTVAAAHGGTTTIIDFAIQDRARSLAASLDTWHAKAEPKVAIDYGLHMILTQADAATLDGMAAMVGEGVTSFKMFMAYPGVYLADDQQIFRALLRAGELGALVTMHAEIGLPIDVLIERARAAGHTAPIHHALTRPEVAEATGTERALALAELAGVPIYLVHLSAQRALARVAEARDRGQAAFAETCPQYLVLTEDALRGGPDDPQGGAGFVCTPPLRPAHHRDHLWRGLRTYDLQCVATDHCPFCVKDKAVGRDDFAKIPNGLPGIETRMYLLWEGVAAGQLSLNRMVEVSATAPAKIFGLYPKKGTIAVGADADLVVWDPTRVKTLDCDQLHMRVDYSPYAGRTIVGGPSHVFARGELVVADDRWVAASQAGRGRFVRRGTFSL